MGALPVPAVAGLPCLIELPAHPKPRRALRADTLRHVPGPFVDNPRLLALREVWHHGDTPCHVVRGRQVEQGCLDTPCSLAPISRQSPRVPRTHTKRRFERRSWTAPRGSSRAARHVEAASGAHATELASVSGGERAGELAATA